MAIDHILLIGFGAPAQAQEIRPFLQQVTRGTPVPEARLMEVERHYQEAGGGSPYNEHVMNLAARLTQRLCACVDAELRRADQAPLPVFVGMRNWHPFLKETVREIHQQGLRRGIAVVLAPHRSDASYGRYLRALEEAKAATNAGDLAYEYPPLWHEHPLFIEAQAAQARTVLDRLPASDRAAAHLVFTAHSIPTEMAQKSNYAQEIFATCRATANLLEHGPWSVAYQSRSGDPRQSWLEPDVSSVIREVQSAGARDAVLIPVGFLCENVEILYDLDIEARRVAEEMGMRYGRAPAVMAHPKWVDMLAEIIRQTMAHL